MSDNTTSIDGHELNQYLSPPPQDHQNPLHSVVSRLRPPPVESVDYNNHAYFTDTASGTRHSIGSVATIRALPFALQLQLMASMNFDDADGSR